MAKIDVRRFVRRLIMLGVLVSGLVIQTTSYNPQTAAAKCSAGNTALPCCSECESEYPPPTCRFGCSMSCKTK
jgi:hypothetical protein